MSNLTLRILSALVLVPFVLALVFLSSLPVFLIGITAISGLAGFEFGSFALDKNFKIGASVTGLLSALCTASIVFSTLHPNVLLYTLPVSVVVLFFSFMFLDRPSDEAVRALSTTFFGVFYVGVLTAFIGLIPTAYSDDLPRSLRGFDAVTRYFSR